MTGNDSKPEGLEGSGESNRNTFARFWRCALQVNPPHYAATYRGGGHEMDSETYLQNLLEVCLDEDIRVIGLADHGSVADVDAFRDHFQPHGITVFPGFEVATTENIHWVCLFPEDTSTEQLHRVLGELRLRDPADGVRPTELGGKDLLSTVASWGGFCYAAHVTGASGLLKEKKPHLWRDPRLQAAQIPGAIDDLPPGFKRILRNQDPNYDRERPLAAINAKDVAGPEDLRDPAASCFVKMTRPSFDAFVMAFKDPQSRIRLHHEMEEQHYSSIERVTIEGGYLDGLDVRFSDHLNTLIGGRGTGKSTLLEALRYALDRTHKGEEARKHGDQVLRENLGRSQARIRVELVSAQQRLNRFTVVRRYGEPPRVLDGEGHESALHPADLLPRLELYGQNEIYELARDPDARLRILDRFLPDREAQERRIAEVQQKLRDNAQRLLKTREQKEALDSKLEELPKLEEQARQFKQLGLEEQLQQVPKLERERQLRSRFMEELSGVSQTLPILRDALPDLAFLEEGAIEGLPNAATLRRAHAVLARIREALQGHIAAMEKEVQEGHQQLQGIGHEMEQAHREAENELDKEFKKLPEVAGQSGREVGQTYQKLLRRIEETRPLRTRRDHMVTLLEQLETERRELRGRLSDLRNERTRELEQAAKRLNRKLARQVRVEVTPGGNRKGLKDLLCQLPGIGEASIGWVDHAEGLTVPALAEAIDRGPDELRSQWGLTPSRAETLCSMTPDKRLELETIDLKDQVNLELNVSHEGEHFRPLEQLSVGQQCTAILHVLLLDNPDPLVMDQPEDNLDNAFIADRIVRELRDAKTRRQFLFATHNANIPVFGDAEWIGVFSATEAQGTISAERQGSIDVAGLREEVSQILEGGRDAFIQRKEKYGY